MTQVFSVTPWDIDKHLKLSYNRGKSLAQLKKLDSMRKSSWYKNLNACYSRADAETIELGMRWYTFAFERASDIAATYNVPVAIVAQVIAALSPATKWERNLIDAENLIKDYYHRGWAGCQKTVVCTYGPNKTKAINILNGIIELTPKNGLKTYNFYNNILDPSNPFFVTIDRHAYNVLGGKGARGAVAIKSKDYFKACEVYRLLAQDKGLTPNQLQAITWEQYRKELNK